MKFYYPNHLSQTKIWIIEALLKLMENEDYPKITVTEIAQTAGIARRTFYLNYADKEDVLRGYVYALFADYREKFLRQSASDLRAGVVGYFTYWKDSRDFLLLLKRNGLYYLLLDIYKELGQDTLIFSPTVFRKEIEPSKTQFFVNFLLTGLWELLGEWISHNAQYSAEEMADLFFEIIEA